MSIVRLGRRVSKVIEDGNFNSSDSGCERRGKVRRDKAEKGTLVSLDVHQRKVREDRDKSQETEANNKVSPVTHYPCRTKLEKRLDVSYVIHIFRLLSMIPLT